MSMIGPFETRRPPAVALRQERDFRHCVERKPTGGEHDALAVLKMVLRRRADRTPMRLLKKAKKLPKSAFQATSLIGSGDALRADRPGVGERRSAGFRAH